MPANDNDLPPTFSVVAVLTEHRQLTDQRIDPATHLREFMERARYLEELERLLDVRAEENIRLMIAPFVPSEDLARATVERLGRVEELALYAAFRALHPKKR